MKPACPLACSTLLILFAASQAAGQAPLVEYVGGFHGAQAGTAVALCDVDLDGVADLLVGCPEDDQNGEDAGAVYVYSGSDGSLVREHFGVAAGDRFGSALTDLGDASGDGVPDYAVGAPFRSNGKGTVYVFGGQAGSLLETYSGASDGDRYGSALAWVGKFVDVSLPMMAIGAPYDDVAAGADAGAVHFRLVGSSTNYVPFEGQQAGEHFGAALDARSERLVIAAPDHDAGPTQDAGRFEAWLVSKTAAFGNPILAALWDVAGSSAGQRLGSTVAIGRWPASPGDSGTLSFLAGAPDAATPQVAIYRDASGNPQHVVTLTGSAGSGYGSAIAAGGSALAGYHVVIGAPKATVGGVETGRVYRYVTGALSEVLDGAAPGERFGAALAGPLGHPASGAPYRFAIGAPDDDAVVIDGGRAELRNGASLDHVLPAEFTRGDETGRSVAGVGDVSGDGVPDLLVGSPRDDRDPSLVQPIEYVDCGTARVVSGADGAVLRTHYGLADGDLYGSAVAALGDINLDGFTDYAVGATEAANASDQSGYVQVRSGASGSLLFTLSGAVDGIGYASVLGGGSDLDGDGRKDVLVGAPDSANGTVYAYSGLTGLLIGGLSGATAGDRFGASLAGLGDDLDGDGKHEYVVGAPGYDFLNKADAGRAYVLKSISSLSTVVVSTGFAAGDAAGTSIAAAGDANQDGHADVLVGIPGYDGAAGINSGRVRLISGTGPFETQLSSVTGPGAGDQMGLVVAGLGDVNQDGWPDWCASGQWTGFAATSKGWVAAFSGLDGSELARTEGDDWDHLGESLAEVGDVDLDGIPDLALGVPGEITHDHDAGRAGIWSFAPVASVWTDLGLALAGTAGEPALVGTGTLQPGSAGALTLASARPSALAYLFIALADGSLPFKGGTLVPVPPILTVVLATSPAGDVALPWPAWPAGLSGLSLYFQYAIQDPAAVKGTALSNALKADVP